MQIRRVGFSLPEPQTYSDIAKEQEFWLVSKAMSAKAKLSDLIDALEFDFPDYCIRYDREMGRVVTVEDTLLRSVEEGDEEELANVPGWQKEEIEIARATVADTGDRFIDPPNKFEFHEYRQMERFIGSLEDQATVEQLWRAIKGKGAFRYFKDTLHRLGLQDQWYRYRENAMKEFIIAWAEENQVPYTDDIPKK
jgi:Uncharacterised protein family (UPF0158)